MQQQSFLPVTVTNLVDSKSFGFDGIDLKVIARGDDGRDYAAKRISDGPLVPICEWVGYQLWRDCGLLTPDFAILSFPNGDPPAFGSRIELTAAQLKNDPSPFTISGFFGKHTQTISLSYPLDAFFINRDRHGRNFIERQTLTQPELLCMDFSQSWVMTGDPFGDEKQMAPPNNSNTWWKFFRDRMKVQTNFGALDRLMALDDGWMSRVLLSAPVEWTERIDLSAASDFWQNERSARELFAQQWINSA